LNNKGIERRLRVVGSRPKCDLPGFVEVFGFINKDSESGEQKLIELFKSADFLVLSTRAEAARIVFSEASALGLPSVTYATGSATDHVRSG